MRVDNISLKDFNESSIEVSLMWFNQDSQTYESTTNVNFTWEAYWFEPLKLGIQLNFSDPLLVSQGLRRDKLNIEFKNRFMFFSLNEGRFLDTRNISSVIRRQIQNTPTTRKIRNTAGVSADTMKIIFAVSVLMQFIFKGGMRYYFLLIRILQLIFHLSIFEIRVPGNVSMLY
jgi:hypothetical protein